MSEHQEIWLQWDEEDEVTWCQDKIHDTDIRYVHEAQLAAAEAKHKAFQDKVEAEMNELESRVDQQLDYKQQAERLAQALEQIKVEVHTTPNPSRFAYLVARNALAAYKENTPPVLSA